MPKPTFDVRIWAIRERKNIRTSTYELRWRVGSTPFSAVFKTKTLADGRRAQLLSAATNGQPFDELTGLPMSEIRAQKQCTWFEHATAYAAMKWPHSSAKSRAARADALATITAALVTDPKGAPPPRVLRRALSGWAFNASGRLPEPPPDIAAALAWISRKSVPLLALEESETLRAALDAITLQLNGERAAPNTVKRKRMVFNNALRFAVERRHLAANPLQFVDWTPPATDDEIDFRYVPNPRQAAALIEATRQVGPRGRRLTAFFGCMYYAAMRPAEVMHLRRRDCKLPNTGWGSLTLAGSSPRAGSTWTDDGKSHEDRALKRRARKATREVPIPSVLVKLLQDHLDVYGAAPDGRIFRAAHGGVVLTREYSAVWKKARSLALTEEQTTTPFAEVPYSLRHAGVSLWLASGVDPTEVARRAGHSVAVLYRFYAKVLDGKQELSNEQIEQALAAAAEPPTHKFGVDLGQR